jgi:methylenetetrahydrofolate dehydrogenase (NADP+) / methenyltetrahydrofolate cyclohydrolase
MNQTAARVGVKRIDGAAFARRRLSQIAAEVAAGRRPGQPAPGLAVLLAGGRPADARFVNLKARACAAAGLAFFPRLLPASADSAAILAVIEVWAADPAIHGILVQTPLPPGIKAELIGAALPPDKDVDAMHPAALGRLQAGEGVPPASAVACLALLDDCGVDWTGKGVVVVARSPLFRAAMVQLLASRDCPVTAVDPDHPGAPQSSRQADIVVSAVDRPAAIGEQWIKPGAIVIDAGLGRRRRRRGDGTDFPCGDVAEAALAKAAAFTPVPGGVGPATVACLVENTVTLWRGGRP